MRLHSGKSSEKRYIGEDKHTKNKHQRPNTAQYYSFKKIAAILQKKYNSIQRQSTAGGYNRATIEQRSKKQQFEQYEKKKSNNHSRSQTLINSGQQNGKNLKGPISISRGNISIQEKIKQTLFNKSPTQSKKRISFYNMNQILNLTNSGSKNVCTSKQLVDPKIHAQKISIKLENIVQKDNPQRIMHINSCNNLITSYNFLPYNLQIKHQKSQQNLFVKSYQDQRLQQKIFSKIKTKNQNNKKKYYLKENKKNVNFSEKYQPKNDFLIDKWQNIDQIDSSRFSDLLLQ